MSAVKVLFSNSHSDLNDQLKDWLGTGGVVIRDVSMDSNRNGHCLVVLYEQGDQVRYEGNVLFAWSHAELEGQANEMLKAALLESGAQFVAIGSNEYGHCLCIIRQV
jgi:hypothetical protein